MLEPSSRRLLLESLQPPAGTRLEWAVGTTYSLDLTALLTAPVAFAFSESQDQNGQPLADPLTLLKAVRQYAKNVLLFCQAGGIHVPQKYQPLVVSLENSIVEARAPLGGSFHAKVWCLRFTDRSGGITYRVLVLSRNLTFDRSWDTALCLEGELRERMNAIARSRPLGDFIESLPGMAVRGLDREWSKRIKQLAHDLRRVDFELPAPFDDFEFVPIGINDRTQWPFPSRFDRGLIISPFVDDASLKRFSASTSYVHLVSRSECLERLEPETLTEFDAIWTLSADAEPEPEDVGEPELEAASNSDPVAPIPLSGLHAKVFVADQGWDASVWTGSANATSAAFKRNVEILVRLQGKRSQCGVEALLGAAETDADKQPRGLRDLLQPYVPREGGALCDLESEAFDRYVSELACMLVDAQLVGDCTPGETPDVFSVALRRVHGVKQLLDCAGRITCRPVSLPAAQLSAIDVSSSTLVRFERISMIGLTSFFVFEVTSEDERFRQQFVLNIPLLNAPEDRQDHLLRHILSDADRVLRFLLLLLSDDDVQNWASVLAGQTEGDGATPTAGTLLDTTLLESLLRALERAPERIDQVGSLISDLRSAPDEAQRLPPGFESIWEPIWKVRQTQLELATAVDSRSPGDNGPHDGGSVKQ